MISFPEQIDERTKQTLFIDRSSSTCGNCGLGASPSEKSHDTVLGYRKDYPEACHVEWKYVSSNYIGTKYRVVEMRPDLEWWGYE